MEKTDYLIIGNSAAGINAAEAIREQDGKGKIIILTEESYLNYSKPLITYYLAGKIPIEQTGWQQAGFLFPAGY
ncbi:MAG: hypothetical protein U5N58_06315 [Actinomycetota bacterium]|nr:hypothetical protein [Actinomycetota bacterium]